MWWWLTSSTCSWGDTWSSRARSSSPEVRSNGVLRSCSSHALDHLLGIAITEGFDRQRKGSPADG